MIDLSKVFFNSFTLNPKINISTDESFYIVMNTVHIRNKPTRREPSIALLCIDWNVLVTFCVHTRKKKSRVKSRGDAAAPRFTGARF